VTPGLEVTRGRVASGGTGSEAVDLGAIRRSEDVIAQLAARTATGPLLRDDPALAVLGALSADVDSPGTRPAGAAARLGGRPRGAARVAPGGLSSRGLAAWLRAAVVGVVLAGLAGTTSLIYTSMLDRLLSRGPARGGRHARGGGAYRPSRGRRRR